MYCNWKGLDFDCLRLFKVMATDDGFCCVFNAFESSDMMNEASS